MTTLPLPQVPRHPSTIADSAPFRELAAIIRGELRTGRHDRMLYATDASLYQVEPIGVAIPADIDDAASIVEFCARHSIPLLSRGGGTSLAGQCTNTALVMDFSANCREILEINAPLKRCKVEPGIAIDDLNDSLASTGLFFTPDPATSRHANIGGCIGNNAAGARSIRYGRTSESLLALDVAMANGQRAHFTAGARARTPLETRTTLAVCDVVARHAALISERFPKTIRRNAGYALDMILNGMRTGGWQGEPVNLSAKNTPSSPAWLDSVNLAHLLCGSEGTLAVTLGATLALHSRPRHKGLAVLGFNDLDEAIAAVIPILSTSPTAVELLDDTVVDLARANTEYRRYVSLMPQPATGILKAVLYVEYFGETAEAVAESFGSLRRVTPGISMQAHTSAADMLNAWKLRKAGEPLLHGIPGHRKPITLVEDNAVPVEHLSRFVKEFREIVSRHGTRAAFYAHASVGVLHVRPLIDIHDEADQKIMRSIAVEAADLAKSLGGVMSGEHGDGRVRGPLLERFFGPELMNAFREVKRIFDPCNLLNPGNIVEARPIESITSNLRVAPEGRFTRVSEEIETYFDYNDQHGFGSAVEMCNGAGVCRKKQGGTMCPSYQASLDERHSTRGRGNALRLAITSQIGELGTATGQPSWNDPETLKTLDLCLSCKACKSECPSNVDIARLKSEYLAQSYRVAGTPVAARLMGNIRLLNRLGSLTPAISNWMMRLPPIRAIIERVMDVHCARSLPPFSTPLDRAWTPTSASIGTATVALFGDCFTMFNESGIGLAAKKLLEGCGYRVVLADAGCCARAKISLGLLPEAIEEIEATCERLKPLILDASFKAILFSEPSCLSAIKDDWKALKVRCSREVREALAAKSFLTEEFIERFWDEHPARPTFDASRVAGGVLFHGHCHQKALWGTQSSIALLRRAVGQKLTALDTGCCGMAGAFGYSTGRFELSNLIGELALFPAARSMQNGDVLVAPGTSCRHQIHDAVPGAKTMHPVALLADLLQH